VRIASTSGSVSTEAEAQESRLRAITIRPDVLETTPVSAI